MAKQRRETPRKINENEPAGPFNIAFDPYDDKAIAREEREAARMVGISPLERTFLPAEAATEVTEADTLQYPDLAGSHADPLTTIPEPSLQDKLADLKAEFPLAEPGVLAACLERSMEGLPEYAKHGRLPVSLYANATPDTVRWFREVVKLVC